MKTATKLSFVDGLNPADVHYLIPTCIAELLTQLTLTNLAIDDALCQAAEILASQCDANSRNLINELAQLSHILSQSNDSLTATQGFNIALACGRYYEGIGDVKVALQLCEKAITWSNETNNLNSIRRAHNYAGALYSKLCEYDSACLHLEQALSIAKRLEDQLFIFAALVNVGALMEEVGLLENAKHLALYLASQPTTGIQFEYLHLINATNGARVCYATGDSKHAESLYKIAETKMKKVGDIASNVSKAYLDAVQITYLIEKKAFAKASRQIANLIKEASKKPNVRIAVTLICAQADVNLATKDAKYLKRSWHDLQILIDKTRHLPFSYENILRRLLKIEAILNIQSSSCAATCGELLREHLIKVKHFSLFAKKLELKDEITQPHFLLHNPTYYCPEWLNQIETVNYERNKLATVGNSCQSAENNVVFKDFTFTSNVFVDLDTVLDAYNAVENWAIATDCLLGGDEHFYLLLGKLVSKFAQAVGLSESQCKTVKLASRLEVLAALPTVIGIERRTNSRSSNAFPSEFVEQLRTWFLMSPDETLRCAGMLIQYETKWWNGCGFPAGIRGENIPIEARVYLLAKTFATLLCPVRDHSEWSVTAVTEQLESMAGIQLDPKLVRLMPSLLLQAENALSLETLKFR